jgi:ABC-type multidrug transport system ATPase subunit
MIEVKNVSKSYDDKVLNNVSFKIEDGCIFGLI